MGWKTVKERYRIEHIVHVVAGDGICIGSPYVNRLIIVGFDGVIKTRPSHPGNEDLARYLREMDADPARLREAVLAEDIFSGGVKVFTYSGGAVTEKRCEELGWPNVTHDGCLMYEDNFSVDRDEVVRWAKGSASRLVEQARRHVAEAEGHLAKLQTRLASAEADKAKLAADFPAISDPTEPK